MIDPTIAVYVTSFSGRGIDHDGWIVANGDDSRTGEIHACANAQSVPKLLPIDRHKQSTRLPSQYPLGSIAAEPRSGV